MLNIFEKIWQKSVENVWKQQQEHTEQLNSNVIYFQNKWLFYSVAI